ncbi:MAG TPA: alpha-amylase family glycosyl hydrolase, partial [Bacteroidota bacterium]|nr:alpha-amylase family glycosyl hydrolase [Bacteroidota bacterium]
MIEYHFHPSRKARELLGFEDSVFSVRGNIILADLQSSNHLVEKINRLQDSEEKKIRPAQFYAICLLHEIYHHIINCYLQTVNSKSFSLCDAYLGNSFSGQDYEMTLSTFLDLFPPPTVFSREQSPKQFLKGETDGISHRYITLEELILVYLQNRNPALNKITELISDDELRNNTIYANATLKIEQFFETQPTFGPDNESLIKMLLAPSQFSPNSILGQLEYIQTQWRPLLEKFPLMLQLLGAEDFLREEERYFLMRDRAKDTEKDLLLKESPPIPTFRGSLYEAEEERFSQDLNWMSKLVLIAKSIYVWLDQLSKKYHRSITRLDQIPDEELDHIASQGFNGLWFIGIWQRSQASQRIKHLSGNPEALASAYSINNYTIAPELGGEDALRNVQQRALRRGIRLASDMVPNHMGIDSDWVINHPDWFIQIEQPPFPIYSFNSPDVSSDERVGIFLEDGYWRKSDAAVVFKRLDRWTGSAKYLYHGNDGTHLPWNDTAQLNFLLPEVREAVIQTIVNVARLFPIIRFDAAMVLTKRHYQRLWFPEPGAGGAIPSRSSFGLTKDKFDSFMGGEFWREVVDRIQQEAPDTLLLAEAFWLLEGYFVRTLGMHRVYNSAFMNMLKKEENAKYRSTMKNVLEYNPQILKRFVNFMNNPDEETAVAQFGKGDKYFGICLMMTTLPGLPMFGHGQVEGLQEKYGMEYHRAYSDEQPDQELIARHEREIFPLLKKRHLFSEVDNFFLYDFFTDQGIVNENVFAFSNRNGNERALIVYHNTYNQTQGWIRTSVGYRGENGTIIQQTLGDALSLSKESGTCTIFRNHITGLEYI